MERRTGGSVRECNRITRLQARLRPNDLQEEVRIQSACLDTVCVAAAWTRIGFSQRFHSNSLDPVRSGPGELPCAPPLWANACHRCLLQLEQTALTTTQLATDAGATERRLEHRLTQGT
ncbi:hypothetical protein VZT92_010516 [Zoarces viviparus]|uniref:Uncharacterized protein n=1 Tax=Zoarces viviparus TaxID=48416 RepID=A0AAW1F8X6_ZOAVI